MIRLLVAIAWLCLFGTCQAEVSASPLTLDAFFADPAVGAASLSPSGRYLALVREGKETRDVVVIDHQTGASKSVYAVKGALKIDGVGWKGEDRLLISTSRGYLGAVRGLALALDFGRFIVAVDRDGANAKVMFREDATAQKKMAPVAVILDVLKTDPDHILAVAPGTDGTLCVWKTDIRTGLVTLVEKGDATTLGWDTDAESRLVVRYRIKARSLLVEGRAPGETAWAEIVRVRKKDFKELPDFEVVGPAPGNARMYVFVKPKTESEGQTRRLHTYDFVTKTLSEPIWPTIRYEPTSIVRRGSDNELLAVCYVVDVEMCDFKDRSVTAVFRGLVKYFNGAANVSIRDRSDDGKWMLIEVNGPTERSAYYLYDADKKIVEPIGNRFPNLPASQLAKAEAYAYKSRDGAEIPAYLTRPNRTGSGPAPLVVMPHGGPEMRDSLGFDLYAQYLANRGYLVFQPNFRGSSGYGLSYTNAGHGQWGGRMQDDITDGVRALIASGQADPKRICIVGASYGGYAALIGGALTPDLYKCVVSIAGVADLNAFMRWEKKESGDIDDPRYQFWASLVGDPKIDQGRLTRTSPITYAANYSPPVLMFHGDADSNVPIEQSKAMEKALKKAGKQVRLVTLAGEAHSFWSDDNEKATLKDIAAFLKQHIGSDAPDPSEPAAVEVRKAGG